MLCYDVPGLQVYLFRRTYPDLMKNHMNGSGSFPEMLAAFVDSGQCKIVDDQIKWSNGSKIHLCHCQHEKDVTKYQGAEIHVLLMDELTHFTEPMYRFLRNRVRLGGLSIPDQWVKRLPLIVNGSNPGSIGHAWVKRAFIDMAAPYEVKRMDKTEGGMLRQYIPAKYSDNPTLMQNDPDYVMRLEGLGSEALVKAMRDGDWDIVAGSAFEKLSRDTHMVRGFKIPPHWTKFMSIDWGTAKPYSVGWYCVPDEDVVLTAKGAYKEMLIPKNSIIRYRELYGWNGKPDEGTREESWEVAQAIKKIEDGEKIDYRIGDSAMWAQHDGPSVMENFSKHGVVLEQCKKDRVANYLEVRNRISSKDGSPSFFITDNCYHFWRTVPDLQLDQRDPEKGPDSRQEDHVYDEVSYALSSRPMVWTRHARAEAEYEDSRNKAFKADRGGHRGRYS